MVESFVLDWHAYRPVKQGLMDDGFKEIHMHDACGGQYFTIDEPDEATKKEVVKRFAAIGAYADFGEDMSYFTLLKPESLPEEVLASWEK